MIMRIPVRPYPLLAAALLAAGCSNSTAPGSPQPVRPTWEQIAGGVGESRFTAVWGASADSLLATGTDHVLMRSTRGQWTLEPAPPSASALYGLWGRAPNDVFAVGDNGLVIHFDGDAWSVMTTSVNARLNDVWGGDAPAVYAAGTEVSAAGGRVLKFDGASWTPMSARFDNGLNAIWAMGPVIFVGGDSGYLARYDGVSWSSLAPAPGTYAWRDAWGVSATDAFFVGDGGHVARYQRGTVTVSAVTTATLWGVFGFAANDVWAVGDAGTIVHYDGTSWSTVPAVTASTLRAIYGFADGRVVAVGDNGTVVEYREGAWNLVRDGRAVRYNDLWGLAPGTAIAVGRSGISTGIIHDIDGREWAASVELLGVFGFAADDVVATGSNGTILHFDGTDWTPMNSGTIQHLTGVCGADDGVTRRWYAVGTRATIRYFDGSAWSPMVPPAGTLTNLNDVYAAAPDNVFAVGENGTLLRYRGPLESIQWTRQTLPAADETLSAVAGRGARDVFVVSTAGHIFHYDGTYWSDIVNPTSASLLDISLGPFHEGLGVGVPRSLLVQQGGGFIGFQAPFLGQTRTVWAGDHTGYVAGSQGAILVVQW